MKLYDWFCWFFAGLPNMGEHISDYLARQKERLGMLWWIFPLITIAATVVFLAFAIWLTIHIATYELKAKLRGKRNVPKS
jgi:hypothetical protein